MRCAIYTRKSHTEGLEQPFNSLDAQRLACAHYIASQASEGWSELEGRYDDGGFSGGTLARPALRRLLGDLETGSIDTVVVYKIDRLSRSLRDFVRLVEIFEQHRVTFVSITQQFSTTSSMGRLTLNVLLPSHNSSGRSQASEPATSSPPFERGGFGPQGSGPTAIGSSIACLSSTEPRRPSCGEFMISIRRSDQQSRLPTS